MPQFSCLSIASIALDRHCRPTAAEAGGAQSADSSKSSFLFVYLRSGPNRRRLCGSGHGAAQFHSRTSGNGFGHGLAWRRCWLLARGKRVSRETIPINYRRPNIRSNAAASSFNTSVPSERHLMAINFPAVTLGAARPGFKNEEKWRLSRHVSHHNDNERFSENGADAKCGVNRSQNDDSVQ